jgi:hypothetical protein
MDYFFKNWVDSGTTWEELFFTQDKMLRSLFRLAISVQYQGDLTPMLANLNDTQAKTINSLLEGRNSRGDRVYGTDVWSRGHREELIRKLERKLGL